MASSGTVRPHVGILRETPLHAALKRWYADDGDRFEQPVDGYVVDVVRGDTLVEVQTSGFSSMKAKLEQLLADHDVRIVHPIAVDKWILKINDDGEVASRRMSPKHGTAFDLFAELVSFPHLVAHPRLSIDVVLTREEELRTHHPGKAWRRRGWVIEHRRLVEVVDQRTFESPEDLAALLPDDLPSRFTTADIADAVGCRRRLAQQMAYCLRHLDVVDVVDKRGNAIVYSRGT